MITVSIWYGKKITKKTIRKFKNFHKAISELPHFQEFQCEFPCKGVDKVEFQVDTNNSRYLLETLINFLSIIQNIDFAHEKGDWFSIRVGKYRVALLDENNEGINVKI